MNKEWTYKDLQIKEGPKPGSSKFQYFFLVSEGGEKKCNYCVWIEDEALSRFDVGGNFDNIISAQTGTWQNWVRKKIDEGDFRNRVLRFDSQGETEIDLTEMDKKLT